MVVVFPVLAVGFLLWRGRGLVVAAGQQTVASARLSELLRGAVTLVKESETSVAGEA